jgi:hypothetical protein
MSSVGSMACGDSGDIIRMNGEHTVLLATIPMYPLHIILVVRVLQSPHVELGWIIEAEHDARCLRRGDVWLADSLGFFACHANDQHLHMLRIRHIQRRDGL